ncbi:hypothetical protein GCM10010400_67260 [Streptomyces aculeolatus]
MLLPLAAERGVHRTAGAAGTAPAGAHRAGAVRAVTGRTTGTAVAARATGTARAHAAGTCRQLGCAGRQLGRAALRRAHLLRRHRLRARYGGGHRPAVSGRTGTVLRLGALAHPLVLRRGPGRCGQLGPQVLVLAEQPGQFGLDLVEERVDFVLVVALSESDGRELLVPHVLGGQRHFFTST